MSNKEIEETLSNIILIRVEKSECIRNQKYQECAILRDREKRLLDILFMSIYDDNGKNDYSSADDYINDWCIEKYGFSYKDVTLTQFKRQMLLNKLDI